MKNYRKLIAMMKNAYPQYAVSVRRVALSKRLAGDCLKIGKGWLIRINKNYNESEAMDTAIHEFAHVPAWQEWVDTGQHGPIWAWHYHICYRIYEVVATESHE